MEKYSSISSIIERMKKQMLTYSTLKRRVDMVAERVSKSQEQHNDPISDLPFNG
jgi:septation ring formation regulator EzrA